MVKLLTCYAMWYIYYGLTRDSTAQIFSWLFFHHSIDCDNHNSFMPRVNVSSLHRFWCRYRMISKMAKKEYLNKRWTSSLRNIFVSFRDSFEMINVAFISYNSKSDYQKWLNSWILPVEPSNQIFSYLFSLSFSSFY